MNPYDEKPSKSDSFLNHCGYLLAAILLSAVVYNLLAHLTQ